MCGETTKEWFKWLPLAKWWYNTHYHASTQPTPYEVVYNQPLPLYLPYLCGESAIAEVDKSLQRRENRINQLKQKLIKTHARIKQQN